MNERFETSILHYVCYIPEIRIAVTDEWKSRLNRTDNPENRNKRERLLAAVKRWVYLSWMLHVEEKKYIEGPKAIQKAYEYRWIWDEIAWLKDDLIPAIVSPFKVVYIVPEFVLSTGRLVQFNKNKKPVELDFNKEIPPKPDLEPIEKGGHIN